MWFTCCLCHRSCLLFAGSCLVSHLLSWWHVTHARLVACHFLWVFVILMNYTFSCGSRLLFATDHAFLIAGSCFVFATNYVLSLSRIMSFLSLIMPCLSWFSPQWACYDIMIFWSSHMLVWWHATSRVSVACHDFGSVPRAVFTLQHMLLQCHTCSAGVLSHMLGWCHANFFGYSYCDES